MICWFAGAGVAGVWLIFKSPALDYRLVMVGSVLPLGEAFLGGPRALHTLAGAVAVLLVAVIATRGRRLLRRRLIGLPIGMLMHLVLDGSWTRAELFWWPFFCQGFGDGGLGEWGRPLGVSIVLESAGVAALVWCWRRFVMSDPANRALFLRTGHLNRKVTT